MERTKEQTAKAAFDCLTLAAEALNKALKGMEPGAALEPILTAETNVIAARVLLAEALKIVIDD
jgi:hypothetical protein